MRIKAITYRLIALLLLVFSMPAIASAQSQAAKASVQINKDDILIGEPIELQIAVTLPITATNLVWPEIGDTLSEFIEVIQYAPYDTTVLGNPANPSAVLHQQTLTITSFDSGYFAVPAFEIFYDTTSVTTAPLRINVHSLAVDTAQAIKDINEVIEVPAPSYFVIWLQDNWPWLVAILGAAVIALAVARFWKKKEKTEAVVAKKEEPKIPAHETALAALKALEKQKLWQQGKVKPYYVEVTTILWTYLEGRYSILATEQTTQEILQSLRFAEMSETNKQQLHQILGLSDLVKFAKESPTPQENERILQFAREFVLATKSTFGQVSPSKPDEA